MDTWEYISFAYETTGFWFAGPDVSTQDLDSQLDELGSEGWELVTAVPTARENGKTNALVYTLKRRVVEGS